MPGGRIGVFKIRHEDTGAGVQRIDDHLAVDRARDLYPAVEQIVRNRRNRPFGLADVGGFGKEIGKLAGVDLLLAGPAAGQKLLAAGFKLARQLGQERARFRSKNSRLNVTAEGCGGCHILHLNGRAARMRPTSPKRTTWSMRTTRFVAGAQLRFTSP